MLWTYSTAPKLSQSTVTVQGPRPLPWLSAHAALLRNSVSPCHQMPKLPCAAAADAKAKKMAENRKAGLRPGQLPPPGEGDGTKGAQFNGEPKPMNLPDPGNVTADDLKDWSKLKGKKREQVLGRMRDQWPEGYRRAICSRGGARAQSH